MFSTQSVRQLRDATIKESFEAVFSMRSVPKYYKQAKSRVCSVVRQSSTSKDMNTEADEATALEAVTRQGLVKTRKTEDLVSAVMNCNVCELAIAQ
jgi:hypothetical protein